MPFIFRTQAGEVSDTSGVNAAPDQVHEADSQKLYFFCGNLADQHTVQRGAVVGVRVFPDKAAAVFLSVQGEFQRVLRLVQAVLGQRDIAADEPFGGKRPERDQNKVIHVFPVQGCRDRGGHPEKAADRVGLELVEHDPPAAVFNHDPAQSADRLPCQGGEQLELTQIGHPLQQHPGGFLLHQMDFGIALPQQVVFLGYRASPPQIQPYRFVLCQEADLGGGRLQPECRHPGGALFDGPARIQMRQTVDQGDQLFLRIDTAVSPLDRDPGRQVEQADGPALVVQHHSLNFRSTHIGDLPAGRGALGGGSFREKGKENRTGCRSCCQRGQYSNLSGLFHTGCAPHLNYACGAGRPGDRRSAPQEAAEPPVLLPGKEPGRL